MMRRCVLRPVGWVALVALWAAAPSPANDRMQRPVLTAFREVVRQPAQATVQVYADGYRAALGAIVRADGYIVTKGSELRGELQVQLNRPNTARLPATLVAVDKETDLAVLKVGADQLPVVSWSEAAEAPVGSWLATPGLLEHPVAIGILSVAPRKIAAPAGALGVMLDNADNIARIADVVEDMAASKAGLRAGDVVRQVNGKPIQSREQLQETIRSYQPGEKIELHIERNGVELKLQATLGSFSQLEHGERAEIQNSLGGRLSERRAGFPSVIQHDSVLEPAQCGGPIVNLEGQVVGLNIARAGRVESYALPAALVRATVEKLLQSPTHLTSLPAGETPPRPANER